MNPLKWSWSRQAVVWIPIIIAASGLFISVVGPSAVAEIIPATRGWVTLRIAMSDEVRQSERLDTLQYQIGQLRVQAIQLEDAISVKASVERRRLLEDIRDDIADKKHELQGLECALLHRCTR